MNAPSGEDWRLTNQERYLAGVELMRREYRRYPQNPGRDHDHCAFCWVKFMVEDDPDVVHEGYCTMDEYYWICPRCFEDFREDFRWVLRD